MTEKSNLELDPRYFREAVRWETDVIRSIKRSRAVAWIVAGVSAAIAGLASISLVMLLPLKTFEPYVIEVDKTTGFMEIKRPLAEGPLTQNEAITRMYVVRFLRARESYHPATVRQDYELAFLLSAEAAQKELTALYSQSNPDNPVTRLGRDTEIVVEISSIQIPDETSAVVRFSTEQVGSAAAPRQHWVSLLHFRYVSTAMSNSWRFDNPLGFQVVDYRSDQETVSRQVTQ